MNRKYLFTSIGLLPAAGLAAFAFVFETPGRNAEAADPRVAPPLVRLVEATRPERAERTFTGTIAARVQSNLGFRVAGKIVERLVDAGQQVKAGQPLMRIDETDLRHALTAKRNAVAAARASAVQTDADERRYASLLNKGWVSRQRYEQAKAASDTAKAQLAAAEAEARVAENEAAYSVLVADADGTVAETLGEPGQVVSAGQTVVRLAQAGSREAVVALPETIRPAIGSAAEASVYGGDGRRYTAHLRQLSDFAMLRPVPMRPLCARRPGRESTAWRDGNHSACRPGESAGDPGAPGAVLDNGRTTGVQVVDSATSTVAVGSQAVRGPAKPRDLRAELWRSGCFPRRSSLARRRERQDCV